ncbi:MAG: insulinase family protein [Aeromicrobium sp.]
MLAAHAVLPHHGQLAASVVAAPMAGLSTAAQRLAPLLAALSAREVEDQLGPGLLCRPFVTADLVGVQVECAVSQASLVGRLPQAFARARTTTPQLLTVARSQCARNLATAASGREAGTEHILATLFGEHRYGITTAQRLAAVTAATGRDVDAALAELRGAAPIVTVAGLPPGLSAAVRALDPVELDHATASGRLTGAARDAPVSVRVPTQRPQYVRGTHGVRLAAPERYALHLTCAVLSGHGGLLDRRLREQRGLTYALSAFSRELAEDGYVVMLASCAEDAIGAVRAGVLDVLSELAAAVPAELLEQARQGLVVAHLRATSTSVDVATRASSYLAAGLDPHELFGYPRALARVSPADVSATAGGVLGRVPVELILLPNSGAEDHGKS